MSPAQYQRALAILGLDHQTVAEVMDCSWRQSYRWARGDTPVPRPVALVLMTCIALNTFPDQMAADADAALKALNRVKAQNAA